MTSQQVVFGEGSPKARIVIVGEGPGPDEDRIGRPFIGRAGKLLDTLLQEVAIKRADVWISNAVKCFPGYANGKIQTPSESALNTCVPKFLIPELLAIKPRVIVALGLVAARALLKVNLSMKDLIGQELESPYGIVMAAYHPAYLLRNPGDFTARRQVLDVLVRAKNLVGTSAAGAYLEQTRVESHHQDKRIIHELEKNVLGTTAPWHPEREYINAWTDGASVVLLYRDADGNRQHETVKDFRWYFYMRTKDALNLGERFWGHWMRDGFVTGLDPDAINPEWTKVYAVRQVTRTRALREHVLETAINLFDDNQIQRFEHDKTLRQLLDSIERAGVRHYEADLTPFKRFVTDFDLNISTSMNETFFDIETDDTEPGFDRKTLDQKRILSLAWETHFVDKGRRPDVGFILARAASDQAEREMLMEYAESVLNVDSDILYAWNGNQFDFPILRGRMHKYGIKVNWDHVHTVDLMRTWFRYFQRGATVNTSFSLQNIALRVLKMGKVDWKAKARERGLDTSRIIDLYRDAPDILEEYNRDDAHKLVELEKFTGFAKIDQVFSRIGNCFARDYHITTKIDSLLLKRGKQVGEHFPTRRVSLLTHAKAKESHYEGGFVLQPITGIFENVAAVDFKSLYPSVMVGWNISPETYVPPDQIRRYPPESLIECPTGAVFRQDKQGFIPAVFAETLEKRKVYTRLQAQEEVGSDKFLLYYRLSYAFKRLGLSFYGDLGNDGSRYYNPKIAEAVTLSGQYLLKQTVELAKARKYLPIYGDTDSLYIAMAESEGPGFVEWVNERLFEHLHERYGMPRERFIVELEYENYFSRMFFVRKKRYAGLMTMYKGQSASFTEIKGFEAMRSDGIERARQVQKTVIEMILREKVTVKRIIEYLMREFTTCMSGTLPPSDVTITKGITKSPHQYKSKIVHVELAKEIQAKHGNEFAVGMKIPFVMVPNGKKPIGVWAEEYVGEYDREWYWDRMIFPPTYRILQVLYPTVAWDKFFFKQVRPRLVKEPPDATA